MGTGDGSPGAAGSRRRRHRRAHHHRGAAESASRESRSTSASAVSECSQERISDVPGGEPCRAWNAPTISAAMLPLRASSTKRGNGPRQRSGADGPLPRDAPVRQRGGAAALWSGVVGGTRTPRQRAKADGWLKDKGVTLYQSAVEDDQLAG